MKRTATALILTGIFTTSLVAQVSVLTSHYDSFGTGTNNHETLLRPANITAAGFGKLYNYPVDGSVYAQPLYVPSVNVPGTGERNVLYVVTMNDKVYAFDADRPGAPLWMRHLADAAAGVMPVPVADITGDNELNIVGNVGILSTPVIDIRAHAMYLLARTKESGAYVQRLYALDIGTGKDKVSPVVIEAQVKSSSKDAVNGVLHFNPKTQNQRPALGLAKGRVIIAWASHEDIEPYHGWIMAYDTKGLRQVAVFCITPNGTEGGIWQSGRGPAIDKDGTIYYETGNGNWDGVTEFGESLLKLRVKRKAFSVVDYYTPGEYEELNRRDADFGSSGPLLVPNTNLVLCGDKHGVITLLNKNDLGKGSASTKQLLQAVSVKGGRILSGPVYWEGPSGPVLYHWGEADFLKGFRFNGGTLESHYFARGDVGGHGSPGAAIAVSADGSKSGSGIVWGMLNIDRAADHGNAQGALYAYDAETLKQLWNSEQNNSRDKLGTLAKFVPPVVAGGKVYAATYDSGIAVYGLLGPVK
jgi:outer membrane protein assembly factor BamB